MPDRYILGLDAGCPWSRPRSSICRATSSAGVARSVPVTNPEPHLLLGISATGQGDGSWLIDRDGELRGPAILWTDGRTDGRAGSSTPGTPTAKGAAIVAFFEVYRPVREATINSWDALQAATRRAAALTWWAAVRPPDPGGRAYRGSVRWSRGCAQRTSAWLPVRIATRYVAISGYDRALALATQAFVVAAAVPEGGRTAVNGYLVEHLRLSGSAADDLHELVQRPPQPAEPITVVGLVVLVVSLLGFTRTLQRTYQAAWRLSPQGVRGYGYGLLGAVLLIGEAVAFILIGLLVDGAALLTVVLRLALSVLMWWPVQWLLLGRRVGWCGLLPGAALVGVGQVIVIALSGLYLQRAIESQAARYGLIGVAFVLVSWLVALGLLIVLAAVLSAESAGDAARPAPDPVPVGGAS